MRPANRWINGTEMLLRNVPELLAWDGLAMERRPIAEPLFARDQLQLLGLGRNLRLEADDFLDADRRFIICSVHGATYEPEDGRCVGGPCGRGRLTPVDVAEIAGQVCWYPSRDIRPLPPASPRDTAADESPP